MDLQGMSRYVLMARPAPTRYGIKGSPTVNIHSGMLFKDNLNC